MQKEYLINNKSKQFMNNKTKRKNTDKIQSKRLLY